MMYKQGKQAVSQHQLKPQAGFSLLEVLVALLILSLIVLGLIQVQSQSLIQSMQADRQMQAVQLTARAAERYRALRSDARKAYSQHISQLASHADGSPALIDYRQAVSALQTVCSDCTPLKFAQTAAALDAKDAAHAGVVLSIAPCNAGSCYWLAGLMSYLKMLRRAKCRQVA